MSNITVESHDFLSKLSIIKNCLSLLMENKKAIFDQESAELLEKAYNSNQQLIDLIKSTSSDV